MIRLENWRLKWRRLTFDFTWLLVAPAVVAVTALLYVPIMGPSLSRTAAWGISVLLLLAMVASLLGHAGAHLLMARALDSERPSSLPIYVFGDTAQVWPAARSPWREVVIAAAGPTFNILLTVLLYLLWDLQLHVYVDVSAVFLSIYNAGIACVNVVPGAPLDGSRLTRALIWRIVKQPARAVRISLWLGWLFVAVAFMWGVALIVQGARFGRETGAVVCLAAVLLAWVNWRVPAWDWRNPPLPARPSRSSTVIRTTVVAVPILLMFAISISLLPVVNGIEAPGSAIAVEPMIDVSSVERQPHSGNFYLTTVVTQAPVLLAQLIYGHLSPVITVVSPERIVPPDTSPQQFMQQNYRMLEDSETAAQIVALRRAGYKVDIIGQGVEVLDILAESPAKGHLQPGDVIIALNDRRVRTVDDLVSRVSAAPTDEPVRLRIGRAEKELSVRVPLMAPETSDDPPRIGISVRTVGTDVVLPFPVAIRPQKVVGGPSAGFMFTLTLYNLITPDDLTRGWPIAGTGTINLDGTVGPIGGVEQKVAAAEGAGAVYFLVPPQNYTDAVRVARSIEVVEVSTFDEATEYLRSLPTNPSNR